MFQRRSAVSTADPSHHQREPGLLVISVACDQTSWGRRLSRMMR
jgi:hypothetical protein